MRPTAALLRGRFVLLIAAALALVGGVAGGLARAGVPLPSPGAGAWLGEAAALHAALMVGGFFGTVIGMERAVALGAPWGYAAPLASGAGALAMHSGLYRSGEALLVAASLVMVAVGIALVRRQRAPHTVLLVVATLAWTFGNLAYAGGWGMAAVPAAWFAFLVVTVAAERLEMTRLMRRRRAAQPLLVACIAALLGAALWMASGAAAGGTLYGTALALLGVWLAVYDIAWRTVRGHGLARYMAVCLLAGYAWLVVGGAAWVAMSLGHGAARDVALHAVGLGFVVGMVMAHAPVILPALARIRLDFGASFYAPLALLHASLALRVVAALAESPGWRAVGAAGNALAIVAFVATMVAASRRWKRRASPALNPPP